MRHKSDFKILSILSPSILLRALAMDIFLPCLPTVIAQFDAPLGIAQWVLSIYFIGAGVGQLIIGPLTDSFGRRRVIFASIILFALSSIACAMAQSIEMLIFTRLFQGVGACGTTVVTMAVVRDIFEDHHTPRIYSYVNSVISIAPILAPWLGGVLMMATGSWRATFYFVTAFSFIALMINYFFLIETNPRLVPGLDLDHNQRHNFWQGYRKVLSNKNFLSYNLCAISAFTGLFMFFSSSSILLIEVIGINPQQFGIYFGLNSIVYLFGTILSPRIEKRLSVDKVILLGSAFILSGGILMFSISWFIGLSILSLMIPNMIQTLGVGLIFGPCMAGAMRSFKQIAGIASATYGALLYGGSALIVTAIMQLQTSSVYPLAAALILFGSLSLIVSRRLVAAHR